MIYQDLFILSTGIILLLLVLTFGSVNYFSKRKNEIISEWFKLTDLISVRNDLLPNLLIIAQKHNISPKLVYEIVEYRHIAETSLNSPTKLKDANESINHILAELVHEVNKHEQLKKEVLLHEIGQQVHSHNQQIQDKSEEYNKSVEKYNHYLRLFPLNIIAFFGSFTKAKPYK